MSALTTVQLTNKSAHKKLVLGLGMTGLSCVKHLLRRGHEVIVYDTRHTPPGLEEVNRQFPEVKVYQGLIDESVLDEVDLLVLSPGLSRNIAIVQAAQQRGISITGDVEMFVKLAKAPIIAITGSNGKSTTATLVAEILKSARRSVKLGGNIGVPVLDLLATDEPDYYVLELSSFQLETTQSLSAEIAVVLNVSEDHMDRYDSYDEYMKTKKIFTTLQKKLQRPVWQTHQPN